MRLHGQTFFHTVGGFGLLDKAKAKFRYHQVGAATRSVAQLPGKFVRDKLEPIRMMGTARQPCVKLESLHASVVLH